MPARNEINSINLITLKVLIRYRGCCYVRVLGEVEGVRLETRIKLMSQPLIAQLICPHVPVRTCAR